MTITEKETEQFFNEHCIYLNGENVIPYEEALNLITKEALYYAEGDVINKAYSSYFEVDTYRLWYLTRKGFNKAISYLNTLAYKRYLEINNIKTWESNWQQENK